MKNRLYDYLVVLYFSYAVLIVIAFFMYSFFISGKGLAFAHYDDMTMFALLAFGFTFAHGISFIPLASLFVSTEEKSNYKTALQICFISFSIEGLGVYFLLTTRFSGVDGMPGEGVTFLLYFLCYLPGRFVLMLIMYGLAALGKARRDK